MKKKTILLLFILSILVFLLIPSFWRMLKPGIFSMHDFHVFRLFEFNLCLQDLHFPCRWAPDSAFQYGEPLFNFYGQFPYLLGEPFVIAGLSIINTIKFLFIFSLVGSAITMFFFVRYFFKSNLSAIISSILYVYAPYRAVDNFVRGALPESLAFIFFPLLLLFSLKYIKEEKFKDLLLFSLCLGLLIITHNLSFLMVLPFLAIFIAYFLTIEKKWFLLKNFILVSFLTLGLTAFYFLPVLFEGRLTTLGKTTQDYYNLRIHFTTLNQLLISDEWGYGASVWGTNDNLSFAIGYIQWITSVLVLLFIILTGKIKKYFYILLFIILGWFALFLTHGKSQPIWDLVKPMSYIQFPWRFLSMATLFFSITGGAAIALFKTRYLRILITTSVVILAIGINYTNFREDRWFYISDQEQFSGDRWQEQTASAVNDFWPIYGTKIPTKQAPEKPVFVKGDGKVIKFEKKSHSANATFFVSSKEAVVQFPIAYFDGWKASDPKVSIFPSGEFGQITTTISEGEHSISLNFTNTFIRTFGNLLSLVSFILLVLLFIKKSTISKKNED